MSEKRPVMTLASLGISPDQVAKGIPTSGVSFGSSSFIGPWSKMTVYSVATETDPEDVLKGETFEIERDEQQIVLSLWPPMKVNEGSGWFFLTYNDYDVALEAGVRLNEKPRKPNALVRYYMSTSDVMNEADLERLTENFGETLTFDVPIKALAYSDEYPAKNRHPYQQIALTSAVAASAKAFGLLDTEPFDLKELVDAEYKREDEEFTDELYHLLCGDPTAGMFAEIEVDFDDPEVAKIMSARGVEPPEEDEDGMIEVVMIKPILSERREALWAALGEPNMKGYTPGNTTKPSGGMADTNVIDGCPLDKCIRFLSNIWSTPIYARLVLVPDPRPEAMSKAGNRLSIAALTEIYGVGEQGRSVAAAIAADELDGQDVITPTKWPAKPGGWAASKPDGILKFMRENDPGNVMPVEQAIKELYMDSPELLAEWRAAEARTR